MTDISTQTLDAYTQHILSDRTMTPADRARHASVAITTHVMQEFRLPLDAPLPVEDGVVEVMERDLEIQADVNMNDLMEKSMDAFDWLEEKYPEEVSDQKLTLIPGLLGVPDVPSLERENWPTMIAETTEGNAGVGIFDGPDDEAQEKFNRWYNDDKDEQR